MYYLQTKLNSTKVTYGRDSRRKRRSSNFKLHTGQARVLQGEPTAIILDLAVNLDSLIKSLANESLLLLEIFSEI
jgi:hypothetical protein